MDKKQQQNLVYPKSALYPHPTWIYNWFLLLHFPGNNIIKLGSQSKVLWDYFLIVKLLRYFYECKVSISINSGMYNINF